MSAAEFVRIRPAQRSSPTVLPAVVEQLRSATACASARGRHPALKELPAPSTRSAAAARG